MDFWNIYILLEFVGIGIAAGILAGLFGVGGGIIMGPFLIFYLESKGVPDEILVQLVFGTVLFVIIFTALTVVWRHHKNGNVIWKAAIPIPTNS
ncbi:MAG: sulfite exporter TauE/SafE family protein, partial [Patescibacteria group bacterium]|nr:sulfite exporter TauE/SafE family protein [Patescibacteria group bacterium]